MGPPSGLFTSGFPTKILYTPLLYYPVSRKPKYSPENPILKHTQPTSLPQFGRPSFTPIKNTQNDISVYLIFVFLDSNLEDTRTTIRKFA